MGPQIEEKCENPSSNSEEVLLMLVDKKLSVDNIEFLCNMD
jgi:hypothetical protein